MRKKLTLKRIIEGDIAQTIESKPKVQLSESPRMMHVAAVAQLLGVSARHVYRLADSGQMPRPIKLGGSVRWDRRVIEQWIEEKCPANFA